MDFKIGQMVICVNNTRLHPQSVVLGRNAPPLKLNGKYVVQGIKECDCGAVSLDVGLITQTGRIVCHKCSNTTTGDVWWCSSLRFSPEKTEEETKTEYKVVEIDKSLKEKRKEVIHFN